MANLVNDKCTGCAACERECPNGAISMVEAAGKKRAVIDPNLCDECAEDGGDSKCKKVCAEQAIAKA